MYRTLLTDSFPGLLHSAKPLTGWPGMDQEYWWVSGASPCSSIPDAWIRR